MTKGQQQSSDMKATYLTQVENRYVFNVSLIFWHLFIAVSTLVIVVSLATLLWSAIPAFQKEVTKQAYPAKEQYPAPVKVDLAELELTSPKLDETPLPAPDVSPTVVTVVQQPVEDMKGKGEYDSALNSLRTLIPPSKYSWQGTGYWTYPFGERYWTVYKQEKYRQWIATEPGVEAKLDAAYKTSQAKNYLDKRQVLAAYVSVLKPLSEESRLSALQNLMSNAANSMERTVAISLSIAKVAARMSKGENPSYVNHLASFGNANPNDGHIFIDYVATIIDKFAGPQRPEVIDRLIAGYNSYFSQNLTMQKEATDLFLPLIGQIAAEKQPSAISKYYGVFRNKNYVRDTAIAQIEIQHKQVVADIDNQYNLDQLAAQKDYLTSKMSKSQLRLKSMLGIGGGILLIVLTAVILVFFSIQRSIRRIEAKVLLD